MQYHSSVTCNKAPAFPPDSFYTRSYKVNMKPGACHKFNVNSIKARIVLPRKQGEGEEGYEKVFPWFSLQMDGLSPAPVTFSPFNLAHPPQAPAPIPQALMQFNLVMNEQQKKRQPAYVYLSRFYTRLYHTSSSSCSKPNIRRNGVWF